MSFTSRKSIAASVGEILKEKRTHDEDQIDATARAYCRRRTSSCRCRGVSRVDWSQPALGQVRHFRSSIAPHRCAVVQALPEGTSLE